MIYSYCKPQVEQIKNLIYPYIRHILQVQSLKVHLCLILLFQGGEIGINIEWKCNLDLNIDYCVPRYSFTRLDAPFAKNDVSKGYNFR